MNYLLFDTCVWLNLADWREAEVLHSLQRMVNANEITIIVPDLVLAEFTRNEEPTLEKREKAAKSHIKALRPLVDLLENDQDKIQLRALLDALNSQAGSRTAISKKSTTAVKGLMTTRSTSSKTTQAIINSAYNVCLAKEPPCHRGKNSLADAVILEHFKAINSGTGKRFFVTVNSDDFSGKDKREPHDDLKLSIFDDKTSFYRDNVAALLNELRPGSVSPEAVANTALLRQVIQELEQSQCSHEIDENSGAWLRSRYGGLTWQLRCKHCGWLFDTGEHYD
jgi:hypothetical protein